MKNIRFDVRYHVLLPLVVVATAVLWCIPTNALGIPGLTELQQRTMAIFLYAALMWMFEIIPAWATSVTTIVGLIFAVSDRGFIKASDGTAVDYKEILASFADPIIMLFLGGFVLAIAANKVGLDKFLARSVLRIFGSRPRIMLLGILLVNGIFSMFMSNTATAAMLLAFLTPLLARLPDGDGTKAAWVLAIPVAANLGGLGTPIGTPPNAIAIGQLAQSGIEVGFGSWMLHMVPYVIVMLVISWGILIWLYPMSDERVSLDIEVPTEFGRDFWIVAVVFPLTIGLWITSEWTHIDSNVVAMIPFALFAVLGIFKSEDFSRIEWHVLWMVAGGFALGHCLNDTGLANVLVKAIPFAEWSTLILMLGAGLIIYMLSTFISNSSAANLLMPMLAVVATSMNEQMAAVGGTANMLVFVALSCSLAMTLPISTPPNALACSSGLVQTRDMVKVGLIIGVVGAVLGFFWLKVFPF